MKRELEIEEQYKAYNDFRAIESDLEILFKYIDFKECHYKTDSAEIRKIILASNAMIERLILKEMPHLEHQSGKKCDRSMECRDGRQSLVSSAFRELSNRGHDLSNLKVLIYDKQFDPWKGNQKEGSESYQFSWHKAYNKCKHSNEENIEWFKEAINSVAALFILTIYFVRARNRHSFWNKHDMLKINDDNFYNKEKAIDTILGWPKIEQN